ncbi:MAG: efflux RND transporter permease subunit [Lachnospiraceae bacterium]|nr:efflux RND transporter permease subunit [Lachnospiraceae bacterium]
MISKFSVKKPYTVLVGVVLAIVLGIVSFTRMTTDLLPSISLPYVIVMTTYVGASPENVEMVVTKPIEASMATVSNIESVSSVSAENYSLVIMEFSQTTDMDSVSLEIRENLDQISSYWDESVGNPIIMKLNPDMLPVMVAAVGKEDMNQAEVSAYVQDVIMPELESIEGVASVSATGLLEESVNVIIRQEKVDALNEKIYAAIDEKMKEAEEELTNGRLELLDGKKELLDGKKEILEGQKELAEGKEQLNSGKEELENAQNSTIEQLAQSKNQLSSAKTQAETYRTVLQTNLSMVKALDEAIKAGESVSGGDVQPEDGTVSGGDFEFGDWGDYDGPISSEELMQEQLKEIIGDMDTETYIKETESSIAQLDAQIAQIDNALLALEQGEITAAIKFSSAAMEISLGEFQMTSAETQLEAALEQLRTAEEQLADAEQQIDDGEKQLADAKEDAKSQADANAILTVDTIKGLLTAQNFSMPAGYVTEDGVDYLVRVGDKPADLDEFRDMPLLNLNMEGVPVITLGEVADVFYADNSAEIYTNVNGSSGCMLTIQKQTGYSTGEVSDLLLERFEQLMAEEDGLSIITLSDQGVYIDLVMDSIFSNIIFGFGLSVLILILFLKDLRPTAVIACSIPISLITAIVCMYFSGVTLNVISLSGLALGIGMLVDNSIVVIENVYRLRSLGYSMKEASIEGAKEVAGSIVASTLTTVCVFLPIVFTEGITRQLFVDMGLTIGYSLGASLVVALTVVPAMASKTLTKTKEQSDSRFFNGLINGYGKLLKWSLSAKSLVIILSIALLVISSALAWTKGTAFMPDMSSTQMTVTIQLPKDAQLEETREVSDQAVERILEITDVKDVGAMASSSSSASLIGTGESSTNAVTVYVVTVDEPTLSMEEIAAQIERKTEDLEAEITVNTSSMDLSALGGSGISIQIRGRDTDVLQKLAVEVAAVVESVEGTTEVSDGLQEASEELRITVDKDKAIEYGLTVAQVFSQVAAELTDASNATTLVAAEKDYSVYVSHEGDGEMTRELVRGLTIEGTGADGETVEIPLEDIVVFEKAYSLDTINRVDQTRYITVSASIADGYNVSHVSSASEEKMESFEVPAGYSIVYSGENETINDAMEQMLLMLLLAVIFMYLIMVAQFQSLLSPFIIMFTIPLAFTGGFFGLYISNSEISVIGMVGFVMLSGIIVNNGIVLVDYMNLLRERGLEKKEAIVEAGMTRLRPVLMTALTTILSMSTMVFSNDMGSEMAKPMAIVTIGGLAYGTLLTLFVIPCVYDIFQKEKKEETQELIEVSEDDGSED